MVLLCLSKCPNMRLATGFVIKITENVKFKAYFRKGYVLMNREVGIGLGIVSIDNTHMTLWDTS